MFNKTLAGVVVRQGSNYVPGIPGEVIRTGLNTASPYLGPFGKGISIVDTKDDIIDFYKNPNLYNGVNSLMNFWKYNPLTNSNIDEKISAGWELGTGTHDIYKNIKNNENK